MKMLLKLLVAFLSGSACYLWLAILEVPLFRVHDFEPSGLAHVLVGAQGGGWDLVLLFGATFWGVLFVVGWLAFKSMKEEPPTTRQRFSFLQKCSYAGFMGLMLLFTFVNFTRGCLPRSEADALAARTELVVTLLQNYKANHGHYPDYLYQLRDDLPAIIRNEGDSVLVAFFADPPTVPLIYSRQGDACKLRWQEPYVQGDSFREVILN